VFHLSLQQLRLLRDCTELSRIHFFPRPRASRKKISVSEKIMKPASTFPDYNKIQPSKKQKKKGDCKAQNKKNTIREESRAEEQNCTCTSTASGTCTSTSKPQATPSRKALGF
jgi:hypothetical protein